MENSLTVSATPVEECFACYAKVSNDDFFCPNCGYPLKGSGQEQSDFILKRNYADIDIASFNKRLKSAANTLYYLAGSFIFIGILLFFLKKDDPDVLALVLPNLILAIVFLALGGYTKKKPLASIVSGLCLYVIVLIMIFINNPASIAYGIIVKIIILGYLIKGVKSAIEIEKIKKEHNIA
jgi:hypothetical protein